MHSSGSSICLVHSVLRRCAVVVLSGEISTSFVAIRFLRFLCVPLPFRTGSICAIFVSVFYHPEKAFPATVKAREEKKERYRVPGIKSTNLPISIQRSKKRVARRSMIGKIENARSPIHNLLWFIIFPSLSLQVSLRLSVDRLEKLKNFSQNDRSQSI